MRISDWSSDVCSSDLQEPKNFQLTPVSGLLLAFVFWMTFANLFAMVPDLAFEKWTQTFKILLMTFVTMALIWNRERLHAVVWVIVISLGFYGAKGGLRSEEHTSELQSLMRISYAVFCLQK